MIRTVTIRAFPGVADASRAAVSAARFDEFEDSRAGSAPPLHSAQIRPGRLDCG
jgi:hypothetical protein